MSDENVTEDAEGGKDTVPSGEGFNKQGARRVLENIFGFCDSEDAEVEDWG